MPTTSLDQHDDLTATLTVTVAVDDYKKAFNSQVAEAMRRSNMKGFRPGKAPRATILKMMGGEILAKMVNLKFQEAMGDFFENTELNTIGQPILDEEKSAGTIDPRNMEDYTNVFTIGFLPDYEIKGLDDGTEFEIAQVEVSEEDIDAMLEKTRANLGKQQEVAGEIKEKDLVRLHLQQVEDDAVLMDGIENEFTVSLEDTTPTFSNLLMGKTIGDSFVADINDIEEDQTEKFTLETVLGIETDDAEVSDDEEEGELAAADDNNNGIPDGAEFRFTIQSITRVQPAEMKEVIMTLNMEGYEVSDEASVREALSALMTGTPNEQGRQLAWIAIREHISSVQDFAVPRHFLRRMLEQDDQEVTEEDLDNFVDAVRWMNVREKLTEKYGITLTDQDLYGAAVQKIANMLGGQIQPWMKGDFMDTMVKRIMDDPRERDQLVNTSLESKLMGPVLADVNTKVVTVTSEELNKRIQDFNELNALVEEE